MIDLELGDEHEALVETVREWGREGGRAEDPRPRPRAPLRAATSCAQMAELQLLGICIPEE